ncbi:hypothetical protein HY388_01505 [Candidatus Daviesbacteria bacterium]|nr:hypothetical protein [Candidatus Daviesbacteria bacterium]
MKKLIIGIFLFSIFYSLFSPAPTQAAYPDPGSRIGSGPGSTTPDPYLQSYTKSVYGNQTEFNQASYINYANRYLTTSVLDMLLGRGSIERISQGLSYIPINQPITLESQGVLGGLASLIGGLYTLPPASGVDYLANLGKELQIIPTAYASHGYRDGLRALEPVQGFWRTSRDIAYLGFVVIFVIIGLMVMLRAKIDPRTVVTIQSAIPRIVIGLILVTFSYAIVGLMFDLLQMGMQLITNILIPKFAGKPPIGDEWNLFRLSNDATGDIGSGFTIRVEGGGILALISMLNGITQFFGLQGGIVAVIIAITVVSTAFRLFFTLLNRYVTLVLNVIFAPFVFLISTLPISGDLLGNWLKKSIASALAFPAVFLALALAAIITKAPSWQVDPNALGGKDFWIPDLLNYVVDSRFINNLIGLGIFIMTPSIPTMLEGALNLKPSQTGGEVGKTLQSAASRIPGIGGFVR